MHSSITRRFEFDAGHRIPDHGSKCRNLHGHRYRLMVTVSGQMVAERGQSNTGMVLDFGELKSLVNERVVDVWDHAFLVYDGDHDVSRFLHSLPDHKTVVLSVVPTAENLVNHIARLLFTPVRLWSKDRVYLSKVKLYETPNCSASWRWTDPGNSDLAAVVASINNS